MKRFWRTAFLYLTLVLLVALIYGAGFITAYWLRIAPANTDDRSNTPTLVVQPAPTPPAANGSPVLTDTFRLLREIWNIAERDFYGKPIDQNAVVEGAIKGALEVLNDPYTTYLNPKATEMVRNDLRGSFEGIGATVEKKDSRILIVAPLEGTPAERAGLRPGDQILKVNDTELGDMSLTEAISLIRGPAGSEVKLTIRREGNTDLLSFTIIRARIRIVSASGQMLANKIAYVKLNQFGENADTEMIAVLKELMAKNPSGLILDLRNNGGGLRDMATQISRHFIKEGLILSEKSRQAETRWRYADGGATLITEVNGQASRFAIQQKGLATNIPLVVLVNKGTASAAEILAGAIQDAGRAPLIGEQTFGKGSVFGDYSLSNGGSLHVTSGYWYTPKGRQINGLGLTPDIVVPLTPEDRAAGSDPQLDRAIEYLRTQQ